jgi:hypothetical protein
MEAAPSFKSTRMSIGCLQDVKGVNIYKDAWWMMHPPSKWHAGRRLGNTAIAAKQEILGVTYKGQAHSNRGTAIHVQTRPYKDQLANKFPELNERGKAAYRWIPSNRDDNRPGYFKHDSIGYAV